MPIQRTHGPDALGLTRRKAMAAVAGVALVPGTLARAEQSLGAEMRTKVQTWLSMLNEGQRANAQVAFDAAVRRRWSYMWGSSPANGVGLEDMTSAQKDAARDVLAFSLSPYGMETAENIMLQQDILRDEWRKGSPNRSRERFSLIVFGQPGASGLWGWRWEGHHLTITFTLQDDQVISQTPKAFSSEPNTVPSGPFKNLVVLPENETLGRALFRNLSAANRRAATLRQESFGNIITQAGREDRVKERRGVPVGDLPQSQSDIVERLIALYTSDHLPRSLANAQRARIAAEDMSAVRFGWAGPSTESQSLYYRIHGQSFLIEFATLFGQPEHHHTIVHDTERNLGDHVTG